VLDVNSDGFPDLFLPGGGDFDETLTPVGQPCRLYLSRNGLRFDDCSAVAGLESRVFLANGAWAIDYDNDGFDVLCTSGYRALRLFHNRGDGTFEELPPESGFTSREWNTGVAAGDVNNDGFVDIYVCRYVNWSETDNRPCLIDGARDICSPTAFDGISDVLFLNQQDGTFVPFESGMGLNDGGNGLAVLMADVDLDGDNDCYVANDATVNFLYLNDGNGDFTEKGIAAGVALGANLQADGSMGIDVGDTNGDCLADFWVCNFENQAFGLYRNFGSGLWERCSEVAGITAVGSSYVGFGTTLFDPDADGDLDIITTNGHVMRHGRNSPVRQRALLFRNTNGQFQNVVDQAGDYFRKPHRGRGLATADFDADGDPDLVITALHERTVLLSNQSDLSGRFCELTLIGITASRFPTGAHVVITDSDGTRQLKLLKSGTSYLSQNERAVRFAVPSLEQEVRIEVGWPGGLREEHVLTAHKRFAIVEGREPLQY
jgi:hypothetical protein